MYERQGYSGVWLDAFDGALAGHDLMGYMTGSSDSVKNAIAGNTFKGDKVALRLWANATQDPNWGYAKFRDTRSRDYRITGNTFENHGTLLDAIRTTLVAEPVVGKARMVDERSQ